jgi:hypothetical protein
VRLLDPDNFQLSLVGLPFWLAACALAAVLVYALFMRGAPHLRAPIIVFAGGLLPFVVGFGLAVAAPTDDAARGFFRFGTAFVPIAAVGATVFELALAERLSSYRAVIALASAVAVGFMIVALATPWAVAGVVHTPSGLRFFAAGPAVAPAVAIITACSVAAFVETLRAARAAAPGLRRRQLWGGLVALAVSFLGLVDVLLAFGIGYLPVSWFFVAVGALLALRSIFQDDLLRARALDGRAPLAFFALVVAFALVAAAAVYLLDGWPAWVGALIILEAILGARVLLALVGRAWAVRAPGAGPLDRVASQFATRVREAERAGQVAALAGDACHIGLGDAVTVIIPARDDWSWQTADHEVLVGDQIPDPLLGPWLAAYRQPLSSSTDLDAAGLDDLRPSAERLFTAFAATGLVPLVVRDELVGLIIIRGRPPRAAPGPVPGRHRRSHRGRPRLRPDRRDRAGPRRAGPRGRAGGRGPGWLRPGPRAGPPWRSDGGRLVAAGGGVWRRLVVALSAVWRPNLGRRRRRHRHRGRIGHGHRGRARRL